MPKSLSNKESGKNVVWITGFLFLIFGFTGALFLYLGVNALIRGGQTSDWPTVEGVVISSSIESKIKIRTVKAGRVRRKEQYTVYKPVVVYEYAVNDHAYTNDAINANGSPEYRNQESAAAMIDKYSPGTAVAVYYNPDNPAEAVLEPGQDLGLVTGYSLLSLILLALAGGAGYITWRTK